MSTTAEAPKAPVWATNTEVDASGRDNLRRRLDQRGRGGPGRRGLRRADLLHGERTLERATISVEGGVESIGAVNAMYVTAPIARHSWLDGPTTPQNEVAIAAGYGTNELSEMMTGKRVMDIEDVDRIAHALGVDLLDLFPGEATR